MIPPKTFEVIDLTKNSLKRRVLTLLYENDLYQDQLTNLISHSQFVGQRDIVFFSLRQNRVTQDFDAMLLNEWEVAAPDTYRIRKLEERQEHILQLAKRFVAAYNKLSTNGVVRYPISIFSRKNTVPDLSEIIGRY